MISSYNPALLSVLSLKLLHTGQTSHSFFKYWQLDNVNQLGYAGIFGAKAINKLSYHGLLCNQDHKLRSLSKWRDADILLKRDLITTDFVTQKDPDFNEDIKAQLSVWLLICHKKYVVSLQKGRYTIGSTTRFINGWYLYTLCDTNDMPSNSSKPFIFLSYSLGIMSRHYCRQTVPGSLVVAFHYHPEENSW